MVRDKDRIGYIGASDTKYVMGNWNTKTFRKWWETKIGVSEADADNIYTRAGNAYEGRILDYLGITDRDRQILIGRLRVNLDGETEDCVVEIKTHKVDKPFKLPKYYYQQVQVELYATSKRIGLLYAYGLLPSEYSEYGEVDPNRLEVFVIPYDEGFIAEYLPRMLHLARCIEEGREPDESELNQP